MINTHNHSYLLTSTSIPFSTSHLASSPPLIYNPITIRQPPLVMINYYQQYSCSNVSKLYHYQCANEHTLVNLNIFCDSHWPCTSLQILPKSAQLRGHMASFGYVITTQLAVPLFAQMTETWNCRPAKWLLNSQILFAPQQSKHPRPSWPPFIVNTWCITPCRVNILLSIAQLHGQWCVRLRAPTAPSIIQMLPTTGVTSRRQHHNKSAYPSS